MSYAWRHYIGGHMGRIGNRDDIALHQQYVADIVDSAQAALSSVDPTQYFVKYGDNAWAGVQAYLDEVTSRTAQPVVAKYTGVLAGADLETMSFTTAFAVLQSLRLDLGAGSFVHP